MTLQLPSTMEDESADRIQEVDIRDKIINKAAVGGHKVSD